MSKSIKEKFNKKIFIFIFILIFLVLISWTLKVKIDKASDKLFLQWKNVENAYHDRFKIIDNNIETLILHNSEYGIALKESINDYDNKSIDIFIESEMIEFDAYQVRIDEAIANYYLQFKQNDDNENNDVVIRNVLNKLINQNYIIENKYKDFLKVKRGYHLLIDQPVLK